MEKEGKKIYVLCTMHVNIMQEREKQRQTLLFQEECLAASPSSIRSEHWVDVIDLSPL